MAHAQPTLLMADLVEVPCHAPLAEARDGLRPPLIASDELLRGHRVIEISHNGLLYRLQATRQGKLILTK